jgi:hypothetical protein
MFSQTKKINKLFLYLLIISGLGIFSGCSDVNAPGQGIQKEKGGTLGGVLNRASMASSPMVSRNLHGGPMLGDYGKPLRKKRTADGRHVVNVPATIKQLKQLQINTYFYPVFHENSDWRDLHKFLPAAQKAGINVVVFLAPPAESGWLHNVPYGKNYVKWGKAIAHLSEKYPNLMGWTIDDFAPHATQGKFTPDYVKKMQKAAHEINQDLKFTPVVYYRAARSESFHRKYSPYLDGIIMPYHTFYDVKPLTSELNTITNIWSPGKIVLMAYVTRNSNALFSPPPSYVHNVLQKGLSYKKQGKRLAGVATYKLHKRSHVEHNSTCRRFNHVLQLHVGKGPTHTGDYAEASYEVHPNPKARRYRISAWYRDSRGPSDPKGNHSEQLLIDGHVVARKDVTSNAAHKSIKLSLDVTKYLKGKKSATITFRLYEKHGVGNYSILVNVGSVRGEGFNIPDFTNNGWTFSTKGPKIISASEENAPPSACNPHREQKMFNAVQKLYGSWWGR